MPMADARKRAATTADAPEPGRIRLDKWLWAARFYRTRSLSAQAIDAGQVRLNGDRAKPAQAVRTGDVVSVRKQGVVWTVDITALSDRRGTAADAARLYLEQAESVSARSEEAANRRAAELTQPRFAGRPTKRERRKLADFLNEP